MMVDELVELAVLIDEPEFEPVEEDTPEIPTEEIPVCQDSQPEWASSCWDWEDLLYRRTRK